MPTVTPIIIKKRPFAIEPVTGLMLPDGIFDACLYNLELACFITNNSDQDFVSNLRIDLLNEPTDDWRLIDLAGIEIGSLPSGASMLIKWRCDFKNASPGKKEIKFKYGGTLETYSVDGIIPKKIFVSRTSYNALDKTYICEVPEGKLIAKIEKTLYSPPSTVREFNEEGEVLYQIPSIPMPIQISAKVLPLVGHEDELPFNDPWWKVIAWIIFAIAAIAAIIAAKNGKGQAGITEEAHGDDDPSKYNWCLPEGKGGMTEAGVLSIIAGYAFKVGMGDKIDPWQRGRNETVMLPGEVTVSERLDSTIEVPPVIEAGKSFGIPIKWSYHRFTNQNRELIIERDEIGWNEHIVETVEIDAPSLVTAFDNMPVKIRMKRPNGSFFKGDEVYGTAVFVSPAPNFLTFQVPLSDSGREYDAVPSDGWFTAALHLESIVSQFNGREHRGEWEVLFFVQNVNGADESMKPQIAATHIGGNVLVSPYSINLVESDNTVKDNSNKCASDERARAIIKVV
jgi:hypothetical protein